MMWQLLRRMLPLSPPSPPVLLGRWGHHGTAIKTAQAIDDNSCKTSCHIKIDDEIATNKKYIH